MLKRRLKNYFIIQKLKIKYLASFWIIGLLGNQIFNI